MEKINGVVIIFLLAFAVSTFIFVASLFKGEQKQEINKYEVKVREIQVRN